MIDSVCLVSPKPRPPAGTSHSASARMAMTRGHNSTRRPPERGNKERNMEREREKECEFSGPTLQPLLPRPFGPSLPLFVPLLFPFFGATFGPAARRVGGDGRWWCGGGGVFLVPFPFWGVPVRVVLFLRLLCDLSWLIFQCLGFFFVPLLTIDRKITTLLNLAQIKQLVEAVMAATCPQQYALSTRAGCECIGSTVTSIDGVSAFDIISR